MTNENLLTIEIDGKKIEAPAGSMLIEVADREGITIPRFCYHDKLSIAASCRMCLVDVERMPKPAPACATPIMDGMVVRTRSEKAREAQKAVMEFLLINHPLDCPICDQGGECELQDYSAEYGQNNSLFIEEKRHVEKIDIGPLVETFMNRCIQCTRCVRYGDEIAGLRELGGVDRGDRLEITTYIEHSLTSEVSGNIIDICPVGALTAKPSKYKARPWEYVNHASVSVHDGLGTNTEIHTLRGRVERVAARRNDAINEAWISDRDRFSYEALHADDRATIPLIDDGEGNLEKTSWESALTATTLLLEGALEKYGADKIGVLVSPLATLEEMQLTKKLSEGLGIHNIDYRFNQRDFSGDKDEPLFRGLGLKIPEVNQLDSIFLVGADPRMEVPVLAIRLRDAVKRGAKVSLLGTYNADQLHEMENVIVAHPYDWVAELATTLKAVAAEKGVTPSGALSRLLEDANDSEVANNVAKQLLSGEKGWVVLGREAIAHPNFGAIRALAKEIAEITGASFGYFTEGANSSGAELTGLGAKAAGFNLSEMLESDLKALVLVGAIEEADFAERSAFKEMVEKAEAVIAITPFASDALKSMANVILPGAAWGETSGSFMSLEGNVQTLQSASLPVGEARPIWKILRVLGNYFKLEGFEQVSSSDLLEEWMAQFGEQIDKATNFVETTSATYQAEKREGLTAIPVTSIYSVNAYTRRATALQKTPLAAKSRIAFNNQAEEATGMQNFSAEAGFRSRVSEKVAAGCVRIPTEYAGATQFYKTLGEAK